MRDIEFRGYSKRFSRWLIGFLIGDNKIREFGIPDKGHEVLYVSQYTGLKDKNGRKIFEGDIVEPLVLGMRKHKRYEVFYDTETAQLLMRNGNGIDDCEKIYGQLSRNNLIIVGNIYDNQELLEENSDVES